MSAPESVPGTPQSVPQLHEGRTPAGFALMGLIAATSIVIVRLYWALTAGQNVTIRGENDLPGTLDEAGWMHLWPLRIPSPHFLLPLAIRVVGLITSNRVAICLIMAAAIAFVCHGYARWFEHGTYEPARPNSEIAVPALVATAILIAFESPAAMVTNVVADIHHWASPTDLVALATLIALVRQTVRVRNMQDPLAAHPSSLSLGITCALATLAKPSLMIVAWLVIPLWLISDPRLRRGDHRARTTRTIAAVVVPTLVILAAQTWFLASGESPFDSGSGWVIEPFWVFRQLGIDHGVLSVIAMQTVYLVPLLGWAAFRDRFVADHYVQITFWLWLASLGPTLFLRETGAQRNDANFTTGTRLATFLLVAATLRVAAVAIATRTIEHDAKRLQTNIALGTLALVLLAGMATGITTLAT